MERRGNPASRAIGGSNHRRAKASRRRMVRGGPVDQAQGGGRKAAILGGARARKGLARRRAADHKRGMVKNKKEGLDQAGARFNQSHGLRMARAVRAAAKHIPHNLRPVLGTLVAAARNGNMPRRSLIRSKIQDIIRGNRHRARRVSSDHRSKAANRDHKAKVASRPHRVEGRIQFGTATFRCWSSHQGKASAKRKSKPLGARWRLKPIRIEVDQPPLLRRLWPRTELWYRRTRLRTHYSHQMTVAAMQIAEKKVCAQRSYRVAMRRPSFSLPNMFSTLWRCLYRVSS